MSDNGSSSCDQGLQAFRQGRTEEAIRLLKDAVEQDPRDHRAYLVLGAAHIKQRELDAAIAAFEAACRLRPELAHCHYNLGLAYQKAGRPEDAIAAFRVALEADPAYAKAKEALEQATARPRAEPAAPAMPVAPAAPSAPNGTAPPAAPTAGLRMPVAPPAPEPLAEAPRAPREKDGSGAPPQARDIDTFELRPLGGGPPARTGGPAQPKAEAGAAPAAPWEMNGMQVRPAGPPRPGLGETPPRRPDGLSTGSSSSSKDDAATAPLDKNAAAATGAGFGAAVMIAVTVIDRMLGQHFGPLSHANISSFGALLFGAAVLGALFGAITGVVTAASRLPKNGVIICIFLWVLVTFALLFRSQTPISPGPILLAVIDGLIMGVLASSQALAAAKRKQQ
jgi:hypothetical protein